MVRGLAMGIHKRNVLASAIAVIKAGDRRAEPFVGGCSNLWRKSFGSIEETMKRRRDRCPSVAET
jgi:hypothetical protein